MPEDVQAVASSATPAPTVAPPNLSDALASASPEAVTKWRETGDVTGLLPKEPKAPETPIADPSPAPKPDAVADPSSANKVTDKRPDPRAEENRVPVLLSERAAAREEARKHQERADRLERELAALRTPPADVTPADSSPAPATDPEPNPDDAAKYPDGVYDRKFMKDQAAWEARDVLRRERASDAERRQTAQREAHEREINASWAKRVEAAQTKFPDFRAKALEAPTEITAGSPIDLWILDSPLGAEVLYTLQTTPGEVRRIAALAPMQQLRELVAIEAKLSTPPEVKTVSDAPPPPRTLGDKATTPADPIRAAVASGDVDAYIREANKRDLAARRR